MLAVDRGTLANGSLAPAEEEPSQENAPDTEIGTDLVTAIESDASRGGGGWVYTVNAATVVELDCLGIVNSLSEKQT